jgi:hypothetical protein
VSFRFKLPKYLLDEAEKYEYFSKESGKKIEPVQVLNQVIDYIWEDMRHISEEQHRRTQRKLGAVYLIEAIAENVCDLYEVTMIDRRTGEDRRSESDRRAEKDRRSESDRRTREDRRSESDRRSGEDKRNL